MRHFKVTVAVGGNDQTYRLKITEQQGNVLDENLPPEGLQQRLELFRLLLAAQHDLNIPANDILRMREVFDDEMLDRYLNNFYGNGSWDAPYWFIGIEPRIDAQDCQDAIKSVRIWDVLGGGCFMDAIQYWRRYSQEDDFYNPQQTWDSLLKIQLTASQGHRANRAEILDYRRDKFLRDGQTCLLEMLPLPLPVNRMWIYEGCSELQDMEEGTRRYQEAYLSQRMNNIVQGIHYWTPRAVVFYWWQLPDMLEQIAGQVFNEMIGIDLVQSIFERPNGTRYSYLQGENQATKFFLIRHPAHSGSDDFFWHIGDIIRG